MYSTRYSVKTFKGIYEGGKTITSSLRDNLKIRILAVFWCLKMIKRKILFAGLFVLVFMLSNPVSAETEGIGRIENELISLPEIIFLYPEGLENGSSIPLREYIYFTFSGNLSDIARSETNAFNVSYCWNNGLVYNTDQNFGYGNGIWVIEPYNSPIDQYDQWHNLTVSVDFANDSYEFINQFYADSLYYNEPLSITPINYPNNSFISLNENNLPMTFKATGFITGNSTELVVEHSTGYDNYVDIPMAIPVNASFRVDDSPTWTELTSIINNFFSIYPECVSTAGNHTIHIKITNDTHSIETKYNYTFIAKTVADNSPDTYLRIGRQDLAHYHWSTGQAVKVVNNFNPFNLTYNFNDGTGNHTLTEPTNFTDGTIGYAIDIPAWSSDYAGWHVFSYWCDNELYPTQEFRFPYCFETVIPQIDLKFPVMSKEISIGSIPIIWSLDVANGGWWNYSSYKFDLLYDTDVKTDNLYLSNFSPIESHTYQPLSQNKYWYFKSFFNNYKQSYPALYSLSFDLESVFTIKESVGIASQTLEPSQIRFKIIEKTTNTEFNTSLSIKAKITQSAEGIASAQSNWINIMASYSAVAVVGDTDSSDIPNSNTNTSQVSISIFSSLIAIVVLYSKKKQ